ncbi:MAG: recombinase family protein [Clostridia bacterium]|nr:recombinase family protein [Clostridia bacterium]
MAKNVRTIPATLALHTAAPLSAQKKRRVAGYARVSTGNEDQQNSYEAQVDYYTNYIKSRADWEFVSVYTDDGVSGTSTAKRKGFQQMIADALAGRIDLIVTKSVSRFARNTVDSLSNIRALKEHGTEVFFEKENIWTFDSKGELLISIMSSLSQEESRSISLNVTWGHRKRMADGKVAVPYGRFLGYDKGETGTLEVNEEQAVIVRRIYSMFLQGMTPYGIAKALTAEGIKSPGGKDVWGGTTVRHILMNEKYRGDALLQKTYTTDYLTKKKKVNEGEIPQYYVENNHTAIIDPAVHEQVQKEIERRNGAHSGVRIFSGKIRCAECGSWFGSKVWHSNDKYRRVIWQCNHKFSKGDGGKDVGGDCCERHDRDTGKSSGKKCSTPHLTEEQIKTAFLTAVNEVLNGRKKAIAAFEAAKSTAFDTTALEIEVASLETEMQVISEKMQALIRENATVALDQEEYQKKFQAMSDRFDQAKALKMETEKQISDKKARLGEVEEYMKVLKKLDGRVEEFNPELWCGLLDYVIVGENKMVFAFRDGTQVEE